MEREIAQEMTRAALSVVGFENATIWTGTMTVVAERFPGYIVSVDLESRPEKVAKICLFGATGDRRYFERFCAIGMTMVENQGVRLEMGKLFTDENHSCGVIFKINTGVNWETATEAQFQEIAVKIHLFAEEVQRTISA